MSEIVKKENTPPAIAKKYLDEHAPSAAKKIVEISQMKTPPRNINAVLEAAKAVLDRAGISASPSHQTNIQVIIPGETLEALLNKGYEIPGVAEVI